MTDPTGDELSAEAIEQFMRGPIYLPPEITNTLTCNTDNAAACTCRWQTLYDIEGPQDGLLDLPPMGPRSSYAGRWEERAARWCDTAETLRIGAAHAFWMAQKASSTWGTPLWGFGYPSVLDGRYRQRQRNRRRRR